MALFYPIFRSLTRSIYGIEQFATQNGYNVIISQSHDELEKEIQSANMLLRSRVDGLIVAISKYTQDFAHLNQFENIGIPVVYYTWTRVLTQLPQSIVQYFPGLLPGYQVSNRQGASEDRLFGWPQND